MATARIFEAMDAADMGYTHAVGSGTYWQGIRKLPQDVVA